MVSACGADVSRRDHNSMLQDARALHREGDLAGACELCRKILADTPRCFEALNRLGAILVQLREHGEACEVLRRAIAIRSDHPAPHATLGNALMALGAIEQALASHDRALQLKPDFVPVLFNRGNALKRLGRFDEAVSAYDAAIAVAPDHVGAHFNRGNALAALRRHDEAATALQRAFERDATAPWLRGAVMHARMRVCDWTQWADRLRDLRAALTSDRQASMPFPLLSLPIDGATRKRCAEQYVAARFGQPTAPRIDVIDDERDRIRIGYFSAAFHNHPTAHLLIGMLRAHDERAVEVLGCALGGPVGDSMRARVRGACDRFCDMSQCTDEDIAEWTRAQELDIAVDLDGHTEGSRAGIFRQRLAPVQVAFLGFPGTTGAPWIDYLVADATVVPRGDEVHYTESIVRLPGCYQPNDRDRALPGAMPTRASLGLPEQSFVFCGFNAAHKITPDVFDVWMRLLQRTPDSVLWLLVESDRGRQNLRREAVARDVDPDRLVFADRVPRAVHIDRHQQADLFLDTLYYNAHTTGSDALWAGLPVVTCVGDAFPARVGASLLRAAGLPELVTTSLADYEELAHALAMNPDRLAALRQRLVEQRMTCALFDTARSARNMERAFALMLERHRTGQAPADIDVPDDAEQAIA